MSRIKQTFENLKQQNQKALISFITAGDPHPDLTVGLMNSLVLGGTDILELGVPFSDPMADGPAIQKANERALKFNIGLKDVLKLVEAFRVENKHTPVVLMGYLNPIEKYGYEKFAKDAQAVGVDGVLVVDMPPEESASVKPVFEQFELEQIYLASPTTPENRLEQIVKLASGFVYYVSLRGVTGAGHLDLSDVKQRVDILKQKTNLPIGVGFGISNAESARAISEIADAIVVGSRFINEMELYSNLSEEQKNSENLYKNIYNLAKMFKEAII